MGPSSVLGPSATCCCNEHSFEALASSVRGDTGKAAGGDVTLTDMHIKGTYFPLFQKLSLSLSSSSPFFSFCPLHSPPPPPPSPPPPPPLLLTEVHEHVEVAWDRVLVWSGETKGDFPEFVQLVLCWVTMPQPIPDFLYRLQKNKVSTNFCTLYFYENSAS